MKGNIAQPDTINHYVYCWNEPMGLVDWNGEEAIVISGGHAGYESHYMFIETGINSIKNIRKSTPDEEITWIIADSGYSKSDKSKFQNTGNCYGVNVEFVSESSEIVSYINTKGGDVEKRKKDKVSRVEVFSHGNAEGLLLGYKQNQNVNFYSDDISKLESYAFNNATTWFGSCNTGTIGSNGNSFAQLWVNMTGGKARAAVNGQTTYTHINVVEGLGFWGKMEKRLRSLQRATIKYSADGSYNYPTPSAGIDFPYVTPERGVDTCA